VEQPPSPVQIDLEAVLNAPTPGVPNQDDPVWRLTPDPGRRFFALPLILHPQQQPVELDGNLVGIRSGRFIAFQLPTEQGPRLEQQVADQLRITAPLPEGVTFRPSLLFRSAILGPAGDLSWRIDRNIPSAQVNDNKNLFLFKIRLDQLQQYDPGKPPHLTRSQGEEQRTFNERRRQEELLWRAKADLFRELRRLALAAPEDLSLPPPLAAGGASSDPTPPAAHRVLAIIDQPERQAFLVLNQPPLEEWTVKFDDLDALRRLAKPHSANQEVDKQLEADALIAGGLLRLKHPLSQRLVAHAVATGNLAGVAGSDDPTHHLLSALLGGDDVLARRETVHALVAVHPPTPVTIDLLHQAAITLDPATRLVALRGLLQIESAQPEQTAKLADAVGALLADPDGPDVGETLDLIFDVTTARPELTALFIAGRIEFAKLPQARRAQAVGHCLQRAGRDPLANAWVQLQLLGSSDPAVVRATLELLSRARVREVGPNAGPAPFAELARLALRRAFGPGTSQAQGFSPAPGSPPAALPPTLQLSQRLALDSPRHPLFRSLASGDPQWRDVAWNALSAFSPRIGPRSDALTPAPGNAPAPGSASATGSESTTAITPGMFPGFAAAAAVLPPADLPGAWDLLLQLAASQRPGPIPIVAFIARAADADPARAAWALVSLMIDADAPLAVAAMRQLQLSRLDLEPTFLALTPERRFAFAQRLYRLQRPLEASAFVGLLRYEPLAEKLARWFAQHAADRSLPTGKQWARQVESDDVLLEAALSTDKDIALAAAAALALGVGGDEIAGAELARVFAQVNLRNTDALRLEWQNAQHAIFLDQLHQRTGSYRLELILFKPPAPAPGTAPSSPANLGMGTTLTLGTVELVADGPNIALGARSLSLAPLAERIGIRMERLTELKNFPNPEVADLPLELVDPQALDLPLQDDDAFAGQVRLPDARTLRVQLTPVSQ
jgi:hypothetical protein